MQKIQIIGHLGSDAEVKTTQQGRELIKFSVATTKKIGEESQTTWHDCVKWLYEGKGKGIADYLLKGTRVWVEGEVQANAYLDKDGKARASLNVNVQAIELLGGGEKKAERPVVESSGHFQDESSDLPF